MRARSFLILSAITFGVAAAAGISVYQRQAPQSAIVTGGPLFPGLIERLGDVTAVTLRDSANTLTLRRVDGGWGLAERNDFPVQVEQVREIVATLVQMEKVEAKTSSPQRYAKLGVEDVSSAAARSKEITLQTASGTPVVRLLVGNPGAAAGAEGATYVRVPDEAQAWLARGTLSPSLEVRDWISQQLISLPQADIKELRIKHADASTITVIRQDGDGQLFRLLELPKDGKLKRPDAIESLAGALADLTLEDVKAADALPVAEAPATSVSVLLTNGEVVKFSIVDEGGEKWLKFLEGAAPSSLPPAGRGMAFRVPDWKIAPLERKLSDLIEGPSAS